MLSIWTSLTFCHLIQKSKIGGMHELHLHLPSTIIHAQPLSIGTLVFTSILQFYSQTTEIQLSWVQFKCPPYGMHVDYSRGPENRYSTLNTITTTLKQESFMKTFWENKKMLVTSIFCFSNNVFYHSRHSFQFSSSTSSVKWNKSNILSIRVYS